MNLKAWLISLSIGLASSIGAIASVHSAIAQEARLTAQNPSSWINVRSAPSTQATNPSRGQVGDRVVVLDQTRGQDGYRWYRVRTDTQIEGWVRGDFVVFTRSPISSSSAAPMSTRNATSRALTSYTPEQIRYFLEVALGSELGNAPAEIRKWQGEIKIQYFGFPTTEDLRTLDAVMTEINELTHNTIRLQWVEANPDIEIYFVPESSFSRYEPNYVPRNLGFFWAWWGTDNVLDRAKILITTEGVTQRERSHLIREELTQSLGLMRDSYAYSDSIFYQEWTDVTQYSELDRAVISLLYLPEIQPGMTQSQVIAALDDLATTESSSPSQLDLPELNMAELDGPVPLDFSLPESDR